MKLHAIFTLLLLGTLQAQSITEVPTDAGFLAGWLNRSTTIEVPVPAEATSYAVSVGPDDMPVAMAAFLHEPPGTAGRVLQVMVIPPDQPGGNGVCDQRGLGGIFINQTRNSLATSPNYLPFCSPYPDHSTREELAIVVGEESGDLGQWQPIYLHAWSARPEIFTDPDHSLMFAIHISFNNSNSTAIPGSPRLTTREILELEPVLQQLGR